MIGRAVVAAGVLLTLHGCAMWDLRENIERIDQMASIGGRVSHASADGASVVVGLFDASSSKQIDAFVLERSGAPYFFVVPAGTYRIAAFVDRNRDTVYQSAAEPAAQYGTPVDIRVAAGQKKHDVDLTIDDRSRVPIDLPIAVPTGDRRGTHELPPIELGEVTTLADPRFSAENGNMGLWEPVDFLFRVGAGFYFLEPYDPGKTPVLFVHGAGGNPSEFRFLAEHLDRTRFQPWFLYYPSGMDIDMIARGAVRWLGVLKARLQFPRLIVVAHSIGGLVSRATINRLITQGDGGMLATFVTISTPWNGHSAAAMGVKEAPVVMPMWRDVAPGSTFLTDLLRVPLPAGCPHSLLFSYDGHSHFLDVPNDGVVAVSSELAQPVQRAARLVRGFDESHTSILRDADVSATVNEVLAAAIR